ncbi:hypothetical protein [Dyadobacter sp. OTU695]|uniref:hypothetical protein n=1 Tax=Dyadobacter sp. OTU695 TaxID=3043860 RepID=UPI00313CAF05
MASSSNQPNQLRDVKVFTENPWVRVIPFLPEVDITGPVTAEVWDNNGVNMPTIVPVVDVDGQTVTLSLTVEQNRLLPVKGAYVNLKFGDSYVIQQKLTPTKIGAIPEDVVEEYDTPGLGVFRVSYFTDVTNAKLAATSERLALEYAERAERAAASATTMYYQWGTWNVATDTPDLPANPNTLVVDGKYPYVVITTPGNLPISTVQDYVLGQAIDQGFLYGQPSGKWAYVSADSAANQQFQKNHVKFQIGPSESFDITQNNIDATVEIVATATVFDEFFGFRVVQPTTITVANNQVLVLSGSPSAYTSPGLQTKGTGEEIYLRAVTFNSLSNVLDGLAEIASVQSFVWNPRFPSLQSRLFEKNNSQFEIGPPANIVITEGGTTTTITVSGGVTVRDALSGYRTIASGQTITVGNNETAVLSASSSSYVDPQLYKRGNGESLYFYKFSLLALNRPLKGYAVLGNVSSFKWTTKWAFMTDKTPVTSLQTRATTLESFQARRPEAYLGERSKVKIGTIDGGTTYKVEILSSMAIRDEKSGYWSIPAQSITLTNNQVLCLAQNAYPAAYVPPGLDTKGTGGTINLYKYNLNDLSSKYPGTIILGNLVSGVWIGQHPSFMGDYIDRMTDLQAKGLVPQITSAINAQAQEYLAPIAKLMRVKDRDVVIRWINGSIDTDFYCTQRPDWLYRFPCTSDYSFISHVADEIMKHWSMQKLRLPGSMLEGYGGATPMFTESATTATDKYYDPDWDLVYASPPAQTAQRILTRKLEGAVVSLSYPFPNGEQSSHFMHRTGSTHSDEIRIKIGDGSSGNNGKIQVLDETDDTWKEANGHLWSQQASATVHAAWGTATGLKESIVQKRLKMRRTPGQTVFLTYTVTHTTEDGKPLCYNGVSYSSKLYQCIFVNESKGSHGINELKAYTWRNAYWKEHLLWYGANTINMLAVYTASFDPVDFGQVFVDFVNELKSNVYTRTEGSFTETFSPKVIMTVDFCSRAQQPFSTTDTTPYNVFTDYGTASLRDFIDMMVQMVSEQCEIPVSNAFPVFLEMLDRWASATGDTRYRIAHQYSGATSNSFTTDTTHNNDLGNRIKIGAHSSYVNALR